MEKYDKTNQDKQEGTNIIETHKIQERIKTHNIISRGFYFKKKNQEALEHPYQNHYLSML
jgi:hypothetical protein